MITTNGGPAFPVAFPDSDRDNHYVAYGMTLRDHFAGLAMQAMLNEDPDYHQVHEFIDLAYFSYQAADAMLKAREA